MLRLLAPHNVADNDSNALAEIKVHLIKVCNILDFLFPFQERPRPTFAALAPAVERNPVTGLLEPHFPPEKRFPRVVSGIAIIGLMVQYFSTFFFTLSFFLVKVTPLSINFSRLEIETYWIRLFQISRQLSFRKNAVLQFALFKKPFPNTIVFPCQLTLTRHPVLQFNQEGFGLSTTSMHLQFDVNINQFRIIKIHSWLRGWVE